MASSFWCTPISVAWTSSSASRLRHWTYQGQIRSRRENSVVVLRTTAQSILMLSPPACARREAAFFPATDLKKCLICQRTRTQSKNRRLLERLVRCKCDSTPATLCNAAHIRRDERVLLEIDQQVLWAKDILYHRSCYTSYVAPRASSTVHTIR